MIYIDENDIFRSERVDPKKKRKRKLFRMLKRSI